MSCLQLELRSHIHLMVVMSLLAQKVPSYLLGGVLWSFIAQPLCLSLSFISLPYLWYGICCGVFLSVPLSLDELLGGYLYCLYLDLMSLLWSFPFISHFLGYIVNHNSRVGNCLPFFPFLPSPLATVFPLKLLPYNRMPSDLVLQNRCSRQRFFLKNSVIACVPYIQGSWSLFRCLCGLPCTGPPKTCPKQRDSWGSKAYLLFLSFQCIFLRSHVVV